jgi:hypothetical protein
MSPKPEATPDPHPQRLEHGLESRAELIPPPLSNYSLSTICPACETPTFRHACKVRCPRCGFAWDCSEL